MGDSPTIHTLTRDDIPRLKVIADAMRHMKDAEYYARNFDFVEEGSRIALLATYEGQDAGYCFLNWDPKYAFFRKMDIPEIQDLSIIPEFRRLGIATEMIMLCENFARQKKRTHIGLGVSVGDRFGPAQILYTKLGYFPDGNGVTYDRGHVAMGSMKPVDDQLCMMMLKAL